MPMTKIICAADRTPCASTSMYLGAKPSQSFSPVPANTSATSSSEVLRRSARNSETFSKAFIVGVDDKHQASKLQRNFKHPKIPAKHCGVWRLDFLWSLGLGIWSFTPYSRRAMSKAILPLVGILMGSDSDWPVMKA